ncbi:tRNA pseudouridine(55) synthase TruB [Candidatus Peregrinibacteria bacterium CG08_land_8_20_14_0_20_41_10]|nr:MAG: tRNA pseudouridine(55) synthase TruB [Candidatus Peregrinibacteria bacterium CG1_02_41_10]PIS32241.1 MAG: tRNA pseudouridine(55) synthase TruB [Candidatus Peregrinibacteria bacterium CG08_land_8_20_14_0_20_41_10]
MLPGTNYPKTTTSLSLSGFLVIDKPTGLTSFDVIRQLKKITGIKHIGHTGTLDPLATGVLVVGFNKATRLFEFLNHDKIYTAEILLGATSDTYDTDGQVTKKASIKKQGQTLWEQLGSDPVFPTLAEIQTALTGFTGKIEQIPPSFSAIKIQGQKAYELARQGKTVVLKARPVIIHQIQILDYQFPSLKLQISCSAGTYIRSLAHDLGEKLGCGGCLAGLRRLQAGQFTLAQSIPLKQLSSANWQGYFLPLEIIFNELLAVEINEKELDQLQKGQDVSRTDLPTDKCYFSLVYQKSLVGIGKYQSDSQKIKPFKILT